jgi:rhamnose transport system permease protein
MNLGFLPTNVQNTVIGVLMIAAVVVPVVAKRISDRRPPHL